MSRKRKYPRERAAFMVVYNLDRSAVDMVDMQARIIKALNEGAKIDLPDDFVVAFEPRGDDADWQSLT